MPRPELPYCPEISSLAIMLNVFEGINQHRAANRYTGSATTQLTR